MRNPNDPAHAIIYRNSEDGPYFNVGESIKEGAGINDKWRKIYGEAAIDYSRVFNDVHTVSGLILGNAQKGYYPGMDQMLPAAYLGLVARVTYDYKSKYLSEFNMGYNGSENFPLGKRFGFFPSFSLGWIATNESFFPENRWLTFMKVRGSFGEVGNDKIGGERYLYRTFAYQLGYGGNQQAVFGEAGLNMARLQMYKEGRLGNPNVTWERARKSNIGLELKFIEDKLSLTADYFQENRDNILWKLSTVPEMVWAEAPPANIGKVDNYGYEIEVGFSDKINAFSYWLRGAYSFARNKIVYKDEPKQPYEWMQQTGRPIDQYFGLIFEGFYNSWDEINDPSRPRSQWEGPGLQPGDMKYKDLNGDNMITVEDKGAIGYSNWPEGTYSFSLGASWKGFDFSVLFQGSANVSVMYASKAAYPFTAGWGPAYDWNLERWSAERYENGEKITFPRLQIDPNNNTDHNYQASSFWVQDGSYLRLKNAEVGYRFSPDFLNKIGISSMRIYASGNNLRTWTNIKYRMDPDARELWGRVYPPMRVYNAGINFQF
jgi:TonB-linked SusC/RagA family outer membrane protein